MYRNTPSMPRAGDGARGGAARRAPERLLHAQPVPRPVRAGAGVPLPRGAGRRAAPDARRAAAARREVLPGGQRPRRQRRGRADRAAHAGRPVGAGRLRAAGAVRAGRPGAEQHAVRAPRGGGGRARPGRGHHAGRAPVHRLQGRAAVRRRAPARALPAARHRRRVRGLLPHRARLGLRRRLHQVARRAGAGRQALGAQRLQDLDQQRRHRRDHDGVRADAGDARRQDDGQGDGLHRGARLRRRVLRPAREQDGHPLLQHHRGVLRGRQGARRERAGRRRQRLQGGDEHPQQRALRHGGGAGRHAARGAAPGRRARRHARAVRQASLRVRLRAGEAGAHGDAAVRDRVAGLHGERQHGRGLPGLPPGGGHLQGVRVGLGVARRGRGHPDPGRHGLHEGRGAGARAARPTHLPHLRGHQRHPAPVRGAHRHPVRGLAAAGAAARLQAAHGAPRAHLQRGGAPRHARRGAGARRRRGRAGVRRAARRGARAGAPGAAVRRVRGGGAAQARARRAGRAAAAAAAGGGRRGRVHGGRGAVAGVARAPPRAGGRGARGAHGGGVDGGGHGAAGRAGGGAGPARRAPRRATHGAGPRRGGGGRPDLALAAQPVTRPRHIPPCR
ncbi:spidroin-1 isoform X2 [Maniola hyperantus]|uniref:spidroin-1 isoform X2 n=1 Tax=Aphantopus hyperantus TaxID=2795564 RepID=UPI0021435007